VWLLQPEAYISYHTLIDDCSTVRQHRMVSLCQLWEGESTQLAMDGQRDTIPNCVSDSHPHVDFSAEIILHYIFTLQFIVPYVTQ